MASSVSTSKKYDVIIYGGTASGVGAAISAAREGAKVALIEWSPTFGGMFSNGISFTDIGIAPMENIQGFPNKDWCDPNKLSSGIFEEFKQKIVSYYGASENSSDGMRFEPHVGAQLILELIEAEENIDYQTKSDFVSVGQVDGKVQNIGINYNGESQIIKLSEHGYLIDATDCGDLAIATGCEYWLGREGQNETGETFAGKIYWDEYSASNNGKYRFLKTDDQMTTHEGDDRIQAYAYMMTIKDYGGPAPNLLTSPPENYDPSNYNDGAPFDQTWTIKNGWMQNNKYEVNVHPKGSDLQEANYNYDSGDRAVINQKYKNHALGYLYYIQNELGLTQYGLATDEYTDNGNMPYRLYVRESRRVKGYYRFNESDATPFLMNEASDGTLSGVFSSSTKRPPVHSDSIGIVSYAMDSHAVTKYPEYLANNPSSPTKGEGEFYISSITGPGNVPVRCLIPKTGPSNILVTTAVSATHVGYGCLRMEPVRMDMGQAAGCYAAIAVSENKDNNELIVNSELDQDFLLELQSRLVGSNQNQKLFFYNDVNPGMDEYEAIQFLSIWEIFTGYDGYLFNPINEINRAEFVKIISIAANLVSDLIPAPDNRVYPGFGDVNDNDWFAPYVKEAYKDGYINGNPDGTFRPGDTINRAEMATILSRVFGFTPLNDNPLPFTDVPVDQWYYEATKSVYDRNIMEGVTNTLFKPGNNVDRGNAAQAIYLSMKYVRDNS